MVCFDRGGWKKVMVQVNGSSGTTSITPRWHVGSSGLTDVDRIPGTYLTTSWRASGCVNHSQCINRVSVHLQLALLSLPFLFPPKQNNKKVTHTPSLCCSLEHSPLFRFPSLVAKWWTGTSCFELKLSGSCLEDFDEGLKKECNGGRWRQQWYFDKNVKVSDKKEIMTSCGFSRNAIRFGMMGVRARTRTSSRMSWAVCILVRIQQRKIVSGG